MVAIPCSALARAAGDERFVSMVALGGLVARSAIVRSESIRQALIDIVGGDRPALIEANMAAFSSGYDAAAPSTPGRPARAPGSPADAVRLLEEG